MLEIFVRDAPRDQATVPELQKRLAIDFEAKLKITLEALALERDADEGDPGSPSRSEPGEIKGEIKEEVNEGAAQPQLEEEEESGARRGAQGLSRHVLETRERAFRDRRKLVQNREACAFRGADEG